MLRDPSQNLTLCVLIRAATDYRLFIIVVGNKPMIAESIYCDEPAAFGAKSGE